MTIHLFQLLQTSLSPIFRKTQQIEARKQWLKNMKSHLNTTQETVQSYLLPRRLVIYKQVVILETTQNKKQERQN